MPLVFWLLALGLAILALLTLSLWHHKRSSKRPLNLIGATGYIESALSPEGAVIIDGELWRARAEDGAPLGIRNRVRVIGVQAHLLLVAPVPNKP